MNTAVFASHLHHTHDGLQEAIEGLVVRLFSLTEESPLAEFLSHFLYDLLRTAVVFVAVLFVVSYCKTYISASRVRRALLRVNRVAAVFLAAAAGLFASTCVCTNVPLFIGFVALGVPLHLAMTYLISSSLINIASLLSMLAMAGGKFTLAYTVASLAVTILAGCLLSAMPDNGYVKGNLRAAHPPDKEHRLSQKERMHSAGHELWHTTREQWVWLLFGVLLSAVINAIVDIDFAQELSALGWVGVLAATVIGVILHTDIIAVTPVLSALLPLHVPYGILFSLTASLSFFSIPMLLMLKKTIRIRYILFCWVILFVLILVAGWVLLPFVA